MVEIACAYLIHHRVYVGQDIKPPKPFRSRTKFIRKCMKHPALAHLRGDYDAALSAAEQLADERNDRMHGAFTKWSGPGDPVQRVIKSHEAGYVAHEERTISVAELDELSERIGDMFFVHFNLIDRLKAIIRALDGESDLGRKMVGGV